MPPAGSSPILRRKSLKRSFDLLDSPLSSTPPQRAPQSIPSDSPTNPFGPFISVSANSLPRPCPISEHVTLRLQMDTGGNRNVHRIVQVPSSYTFWHLHKLVLFLFGWKEEEYNKHSGKTRKLKHQIIVQKEVTMWAASHKVGFVKGGRTWVVMGYLQQQEEKSGTKRRRTSGDEGLEGMWEREEAYALQNAWPRGEDPSRAVTYHHDAAGRNPCTVYITTASSKRSVTRRGSSNVPFVLSAKGLPNDDDDDDDFPIDLEQWNSPHAFEEFAHGSEEYGCFDIPQSDWTPVFRKQRIDEEHKRLRDLASEGLDECFPDKLTSKKAKKEPEEAEEMKSLKSSQDRGSLSDADKFQIMKRLRS